jgi:hypothetical protein
MLSIFLRSSMERDKRLDSTTFRSPSLNIRDIDAVHCRVLIKPTTVPKSSHSSFFPSRCSHLYTDQSFLGCLICGIRCCTSTAASQYQTPWSSDRYSRAASASPNSHAPPTSTPRTRPSPMSPPTLAQSVAPQNIRTTPVLALSIPRRCNATQLCVTPTPRSTPLPLPLHRPSTNGHDQDQDPTGHQHPAPHHQN